MGLTTVKLKIKNPKEENKVVERKFLVDSGANYTVVPETIVKKLSLKPLWEQEFSLANGKTIKRKIGNAIIEFRKRGIAGPVVLGKKNDSPLLGTLTLEALGLILDPFERKIYRTKLMLASCTTTTRVSDWEVLRWP